VRQDPDDRDANQGLGAALQRLGDPEAKKYQQIAARRDQYKRIIVASGNSARIDLGVFAQIGEICESLGRPDQARVWYQVAIGWNPLDAEAQKGLNRLGQAVDYGGSSSIRDQKP
jgi:hypothetical protein